MTISVGARVQVSDQYYTGVAIVLQVDRAIPAYWPASERLPYYCHLIELCDHDLCLPYDGCVDGKCLRWYSIAEEGEPPRFESFGGSATSDAATNSAAWNAAAEWMRRD